MGSNAARVFATSNPAPADSLRELELAALGFRDVVDVFGGGRGHTIEAYALDCEGTWFSLGRARVNRDAASTRVALFASLLIRGLRAPNPVLVDTANCAVLRRRVLAAWGERAVFVG